jgi:hypothetical protein
MYVLRTRVRTYHGTNGTCVLRTYAIPLVPLVLQYTCRIQYLTDTSGMPYHGTRTIGRAIPTWHLYRMVLWPYRYYRCTYHGRKSGTRVRTIVHVYHGTYTCTWYHWYVLEYLVHVYVPVVPVYHVYVRTVHVYVLTCVRTYILYHGTPTLVRTIDPYHTTWYECTYYSTYVPWWTYIP